MRIVSTNQYLSCLNKIAEIIDKSNPSSKEISLLEIMSTAVCEFEYNEIKKYPATDFLVERFFANSFNKN